MDYKEIAKKFFIPGYGLYKEIQKPKKDRNLLSTAWAHSGIGEGREELDEICNKLKQQIISRKV